MVTLLIIILHDPEKMPELLDAWKKAGVPGVTILQSAGGFHAEDLVKRGGLSGLLRLFEPSDHQQRLLFSLVDDQNILQLAISEAERVVGGFDRPHSGILFTLPVGEVLGLQKWEQEPIDEQNALGVDTPTRDKGAENLLSWYEKEIEEKHGKARLKEWKKKKGQSVSTLIKKSKYKPTIVQVDTSLKELVGRFLDNPEVSLACVINQEERLVGIIDESKAGDMMLVPAMPENFIQNPDEFDQAIKYARLDPDSHVSSVMDASVFVTEKDTLEEAYTAMKTRGLTGIPVVDNHYRVTGYLTLIEVLEAYYGE